MMASNGVGLMQFEKVPFVVETSGAFGKEARALWKWFKAVVAKEQEIAGARELCDGREALHVPGRLSPSSRCTRRGSPSQWPSSQLGQ